MNPKLGRIPSPVDYRDHNFLAAARLVQLVPETRRRWFVPSAWDQGQTSMCVAFSSLMYLTAGPVRNKRVTENDTGDFYGQCQAIDGFPGPHDGTSVRAAMQILQQQQYITAYLWAFDVGTVANWILAKSPVVLGTDWLDSMFDTVKFRGSQFINFDASSPVAGGHAYLAIGADKAKKCPDGSTGAIEIQNSWGLSWGQKGRAFLSFKAAAALLAESGEAAMASEILKK